MKFQILGPVRPTRATNTTIVVNVLMIRIAGGTFATALLNGPDTGNYHREGSLAYRWCGLAFAPPSVMEQILSPHATTSEP